MHGVNLPKSDLQYCCCGWLCIHEQALVYTIKPHRKVKVITSTSAFITCKKSDNNNPNVVMSTISIIDHATGKEKVDTKKSGKAHEITNHQCQVRLHVSGYIAIWLFPLLFIRVRFKKEDASQSGYYLKLNKVSSRSIEVILRIILHRFFISLHLCCVVMKGSLLEYKRWISVKEIKVHTCDLRAKVFILFSFHTEKYFEARKIWQ